MAKKKRKKSAGSDGIDANERRRERLEARRAAKAHELALKQRAEARQKLITRLVVLALLLGVIWFIWLRKAPTPESIEGHAIQSFSTSGLQQHTDAKVNYPTSPPVSGEHNPSPAECGVHGSPIQNEMQVHSLEHGAVGIQYRPGAVSAEDIAAIEAIVGDYDSQVFSAPYPDMEPAIAVTSWAKMMRLDAFDASAIRTYVETFRNKGPEAGAECPNTSDVPFVPEPSPTPSG